MCCVHHDFIINFHNKIDFNNNGVKIHSVLCCVLYIHIYIRGRLGIDGTHTEPKCIHIIEHKRENVLIYVVIFTFVHERLSCNFTTAKCNNVLMNFRLYQNVWYIDARVSVMHFRYPEIEWFGTTNFNRNGHILKEMGMFG